VSLYVSGRRCLVVGSGPLAEERVGRLRDAGAVVELVAAERYHAGLCDGAFLVFACDAAIAPAVSADARGRGILVYCLDLPDLSDLAMPALARRGPLSIAISTDAVAPALSRRLREELERLLATGGEALDELIAELGRRRDELPRGGRKETLSALAGTLSIEGRIRVD
jgi:siroheme synthase (precorrin-2 oxidase/ferrochelatase)